MSWFESVELWFSVYMYKHDKGDNKSLISNANNNVKHVSAYPWIHNTCTWNIPIVAFI